jgi:3'-phosphoadenosine 5'-phosphosulfate sulfotransferase (PAPS reductase)/FAD synthetase
MHPITDKPPSPSPQTRYRPPTNVPGDRRIGRWSCGGAEAEDVEQERSAVSRDKSARHPRCTKQLLEESEWGGKAQNLLRLRVDAPALFI